MNNELIQFTQQALAQGATRSEIRKALQKAGWETVDINAALAAFADVPFIVPIPQPKPYVSAAETFMTLLMFTALYIATFSLGAMLFEFIDRLLPDPALANNGQHFNEFLRYNISSILVSFPLFLYTFHATQKSIQKNPQRRNSRPRQWLTYLTLFVTAFVLICTFTSLIYSFLGGAVTLRFLLKLGTITLLAGGIFIYFLTDIRNEEAQ